MNSILQSVGDWFSDGIGGFFYNTCYMISASLCWIVGILNQIFSVMSGQTMIRYDGKTQTLMDVFVGNSVVQKVYWGMALIGIVFCFMFAIIAVARKAVDSSDKMRQSMGGILTGMFKGILIIISLTFVFSAVLSLTNKLLSQITYTFNHADSLGEETSIEFTDEQYAAMARVLDTIGNYSLNTSYDSRYNLNSCYSEIRADLQYLMQQGVFDFNYTSEDGDSWQSAIQEIVNAADPSQDLPFDVYDDAVGNALLNCMKLMKTDKSFGPLRSYTRKYSNNNANVPLDRLIFLAATMRAAKNPSYNQNVSLEDPLRGAYYTEEKNIYDNTQVSKDFKLSDINYLALWAVAFKLMWDLAVLIIDCVARIFNMIFLYIAAPPFIGVMPLDDGGKFKQWITAFVVQCFGVFGTIIAMRVMLLFIPIIIDSDLVLFDNDMLNLVGKLVMILGGMSTAKRASGVITGILADNAGYQALLASNMGESVRNTADHIRNRLTGVGDMGMFGSGNGKGLLSMPGWAWDKMTGGSSGGSGGSGGSGSSGGGSRPSKYSGGTKDTGASGGGTSGGEESGTGTENEESGTQTTNSNPNPLTQRNIRLEGDKGGVDAGPQPTQAQNNQKPKKSQQQVIDGLFGAGAHQAYNNRRQNNQQQPAQRQNQQNQQQGQQNQQQGQQNQQQGQQNQQQGPQGGNNGPVAANNNQQPPLNNQDPARRQQVLNSLYGRYAPGYNGNNNNNNGPAGAQQGGQGGGAAQNNNPVQQLQNNNNQQQDQGQPVQQAPQGADNAPGPAPQGQQNQQQGPQGGNNGPVAANNNQQPQNNQNPVRTRQQVLNSLYGEGRVQANNNPVPQNQQGAQGGGAGQNNNPVQQPQNNNNHQGVADNGPNAAPAQNPVQQPVQAPVNNVAQNPAQNNNNPPAGSQRDFSNLFGAGYRERAQARQNQNNQNQQPPAQQNPAPQNQNNQNG